jgi:hypothetical protein
VLCEIPPQLGKKTALLLACHCSLLPFAIMSPRPEKGISKVDLLVCRTLERIGVLAVAAIFISLIVSIDE